MITSELLDSVEQAIEFIQSNAVVDPKQTKAFKKHLEALQSLYEEAIPWANAQMGTREELEQLANQAIAEFRSKLR